jgi:type II secretory pathway predicted ATPase ExeA
MSDYVMSEKGQAKPTDGGRQAPGKEFFAGGDRKIHLEKLRHLSQWSRRVLVVTGPRGVGKTTLYRQLSASLEPRAKAARINGALINSAREVLNAVVQGFGLAAPVGADTALLSDLIGAHAEAQERSKRFCVTMIDDAELLDARALEQLISLAGAAPMRIVLFGEIRLVPAVERAASSSNVGWHEIRLGGLGATEVRDYLDWRFRQQGYSDRLPFSDAQVRDIARLSEGLPGRIDQMADVLLAKVQTGAAEHQRRLLPAAHRALLAVLVVALAFAYLVWQPAEDREGGDQVAIERLVVPPSRQAPVAEDDPAVATEPTRPPEPLTEQPASEDSAADMARIEQREPPVREPEPAPPDAAEQATEAPAAQAPIATDLELDVAESTTTPEPTPDPDAGPREAPWIMRQPASAYTLQLVTFSSAERANAYLASQSDPEPFARYRLQQAGRILHVVIYGTFDGRQAAEQAATRLPASVGSVQPWVRTFGQVQDAARTALQQ